MDFLISEARLGSCVNDPNKIADIVSNTIIPAICLNDFSVESDTVLYHFPKFTDRTQSGSATGLLKTLISRNSLIKTRYTYKSVGYMVHIGRGLILSPTGKILLCLGVKKERFLSELENSDLRESVDFNLFTDEDIYYRDFPFIGYNEFVLYISTDMFLYPEYEALYKKIQKDYINFCYSKGVEVRIVTSQVIEQNTFANEFKIQFRTIQELDYNLKNEVKFLLSNPVSYFVNHSLFIEQPTFEPPYIDTLEEEASSESFVESPLEEEASLFLRQEAAIAQGIELSRQNPRVAFTEAEAEALSLVPRDFPSLTSRGILEQESQEHLEQTPEDTSENVSTNDLPFN